MKHFLTLFTVWGILSGCDELASVSSDGKNGSGYNGASQVQMPETPDETAPSNNSLEVIVADAKRRFEAYIPTIEQTNEAIVQDWETYTSDFNGDGLDDVLIYFALTPAEGGNMNLGQGLAFYENTGTGAKVVAGYQPDFPFLFERVSHGKIYISEPVYDDDDDPCCPSLKRERELTILGSRIHDRIL